MSDRIYIDTNIWVYLYSEEGVKSEKSASLINERFSQIAISTQVLNELFNVVAIKLKLKSKVEAKLIINDLIDSFEIVLLTCDTIMSAIDISLKYQFRFFDSLMVATALQYNCTIFFSEDLQDGQIIEDRLQIVNPFK